MSITISDKVEFKGRVRGWAERLDVRVTSISVRSMSTKWGSYSTAGRLTFDVSLLELREELQSYVIAHEILHSRAPNHGKLWKSLMRAHLGDYEQLEGELRRIASNRTNRAHTLIQSAHGPVRRQCADALGRLHRSKSRDSLLRQRRPKEL